MDLDNFGASSATSAPSGSDLDVNVDNFNNNNISNANSSLNDNDGGEDEAQLELYDNFAASVVKPNMQTLPPPMTPIMSDADAINATSLTPTKSPTLGRSLTPSMTPSPVSQRAVAGGGGGARPTTGTGPRSLSRETSAEQSKGSPYSSATM